MSKTAPAVSRPDEIAGVSRVSDVCLTNAPAEIRAFRRIHWKGYEMATLVPRGAEQRDQFLERHTAALVQKLAELDAEIGDRPATVDAYFDRLCDALGEARRACRELELDWSGGSESLQLLQAEYRERIAPWLDRSWFMHRAKTKPCGYPGDYLILEQIYEGVPKSRGIGGYLDLYFLATPLGRAVRQRLGAAREFLQEQLMQRVEQDVSIMNVACGPCREYRDPLLHPGGHQVKITCIDNEPDALNYVSEQIVPTYEGTTTEFQMVRYNAIRLSSARVSRRKFGAQDIIYSVGLCDYLPDRLLVPMFTGLRESLNDDGVLYIAFKDCKQYENTDYHWLVDWHFLPREESDCWRLFKQAGFNLDHVEMKRDGTRIIMNYAALSRRRQVHIDEAQTQIERSGKRTSVVRNVRK